MFLVGLVACKTAMEKKTNFTPGVKWDRAGPRGLQRNLSSAQGTSDSRVLLTPRHRLSGSWSPACCCRKHRVWSKPNSCHLKFQEDSKRKTITTSREIGRLPFASFSKMETQMLRAPMLQRFGKFALFVSTNVWQLSMIHLSQYNILPNFSPNHTEKTLT